MSKANYNPDEHLVDILEPPHYLPGGKTQGIVDAIRAGDWLNVVNLWVYKTSPSLQILFQQREPNSPMHPGHLDCSSGGHLEAGEDPLDGALRELKEELGIEVDKSSVVNMGRHFNVGPDHKGRERRRVISKFVLEFTGNDEDIKANPHEVDATFWVDVKEFLKLEAGGSMEIHGKTAEGQDIARTVTKDDFTYNLDDYHFRFFERLIWMQNDQG